ncbi:alpha/beta hydrolase [Streptomyces sp. ISL-44]|uniref:alpha/beta fold hydrolase n=1 Tax=unclassified Streptomyces TaxID=2593676 RepID=UPI001BE6B1F0|nr:MULTISPECIES: alpha/beta hydrolase [unclassified Streptomyces]MBT2542181.1 alpha/beta hydrolase [Streptomyces sp. ISL-44]MCX5012268.1 alpha/beta hydrolase [Streptomyces sp. NBC_00555]MCX5606233.1 alpha/beta hydrolase [Streptomyces sp. NBC_00047]UUU40481.1 alpha/beta hydrolase [Streptomyces sp. NBC_00162]
MSENWRKAGWAGAAIGVIAAGAAAGVAVERITVGRGMRMKARLALDAAGDYGSLRGTQGTCRAEDATELYYEVDELPEDTKRPRSRLRRKPAPGATVVFCHGYCLGQDSWHFQRAALRGVVRTVYWDQRSHGRSARGLAQADGEPVTIDQLGRDLKAVIDAAAPEGPLILVGHSMGGMTIMGFAEQFPDLVRDRVVGVTLVGTSSGRLDEVTYGLPSVGLGAVRRILPGVLKALGSQVELVEKGRRATADLFAGMIKMYSFGSRDVDPGVARFAERLIEATPIDVVAEFYPAFQTHDKTEALQRFADIPVTVVAGDNDMITPPGHSVAMKEALPSAELVILESTGHLMMLERPETVTRLLTELLARTGAVPALAATNVGGHGRSTAGSTAQPGTGT